MPSFDAVSKVDLMEMDNALAVARKEIENRYDFRATNTAFERGPEGIVLRSSDETRAEAALAVLRERMARRNLPPRCLDPGPVEAAAGRSVRQLIKIKQGIDTETGKKIVKALKDSKIKVQAQIQDEQVRVTGKNRDDLQAAIALIKRGEYGLDVQFANFRD